MKITVDADLCQGHGECALTAPELFDLGDDTGTVKVLDAEPPAHLHQIAFDAERACPVGAIKIES